TSFNGAVTVAIATGPAGATLGGTTTVTAVNGVATFTGLTLDLAGTYTLTASGGGLTAVTTNAITVTPVVVATQLVVTTQPPTTVLTNTPFGLVVTAENATGQV